MFYWNFDREEATWNNSGESIKECIEEARLYAEDEGQEFVYIGEVTNHVPTIDAERVIDNLTEQAYYECGECSEGWLDGAKTEELEEKLNEVLQEWLKETNQEPTFGKLEKIHRYDLKTGQREKRIV